MATVVSMPRVGMSVESCILTEWVKKPGDRVEKGDILFRYETDKSSMECESTLEGQLLEVFYKEFDEVPVLAVVCVIGEAGEDISALYPESGEQQSTLTQQIDEVSAPEKAAPAEPVAAIPGDQLRASPRARRLAEQRHADLRFAKASGAGGRIIERDVQQLVDRKTGIMTAAAAALDGAAVAEGTGIGARITVTDRVNAQEILPQGNEYKDIRMSVIRRTIARNMEKSVFELPQLTHHFSFDATCLLDYRARLKADPASPRITLGDLVLFAVSRVLKRYPELNAYIIEGDTIRCFEDVNLGVAVDTPRGLVVPVLPAADRMSLEQIAKETKRLAQMAQEGTLGIDDMSGGTFTVSNLGTVGVESFTPILNPPQTGILGVCCITDRVKKTQDGIDVYPAMGISLTYDHRAIDGAPASRFAVELCQALEDFPQSMKDEGIYGHAGV